MPISFNTPAKKLIRLEWNKPLLKFLSENLNAKLVYLGLPSPDAEDVSEWIDYLDVVISFQCREYPEPSDASQSREAVQELVSKLSAFERQQKLTTFYVYDGYIEEVILKGRDNSNLEFVQNEIVTIYNLDFCNQITSPYEFLDINGEVKKAYKFEAINKLLQIQASINDLSKKFIMLFTIHCGYRGAELNEFMTNCDDKEIIEYCRGVNSLRGVNKKARILRSYILYTLKHYLRTYDFVPEFLPVILYEGVSGFYLLHFMIIGTTKLPNPALAPFYQRTKSLLNQKFLTISNNQIGLMKTQDIEESDVDLDPIKVFTSSKAFSKLWKS
jgi:hypothetical protein